MRGKSNNRLSLGLWSWELLCQCMEQRESLFTLDFSGYTWRYQVYTETMLQQSDHICESSAIKLENWQSNQQHKIYVNQILYGAKIIKENTQTFLLLTMSQTIFQFRSAFCINPSIFSKYFPNSILVHTETLPCHWCCVTIALLIWQT